MQVLDVDTSLAVKILLWVVLREVGPLAAAMVVILRTGTAMSRTRQCSSPAGRPTLRTWGSRAYDYLVVPRVAGVMIAGPRRSPAISVPGGGRRRDPQPVRHPGLSPSSTRSSSTWWRRSISPIDPEEPDVRLPSP
jgi:hypothetical protein